MTFESYQCPKTGAPLIKADQSTIDLVNQAISEKTLVTVSGQEVETEIDGIWIASEMKIGYLQRNAIVCLIESDAVRLKNLEIDFQNLDKARSESTEKS